MDARFVALRFRTSIDSEEALQGFMMMNANVEGVEEAPDGSITFYIPKAEWSPDFENILQTFLQGHPEADLLGAAVMEERDWNAEWESSIEPQRVTDSLVITPSWKLEQAEALNAEYLIRIDPKMSFGTGHHETTRLCLQSLEHLDVNNRSVLDIGTGSGVLAIYALQRGADFAVGIDTDPWSIENAQENRSLNDFTAAQLDIRDGMLQNAVRTDERFDVILANIHRNVLIEISSQIRGHCNAGAQVVLSGLLIYDVVEVQKAYEAAGFQLHADRRENEWACLTFAL